MLKLFKKKKENKITGWNNLPVKYLKSINEINRNESLSTDDKILNIVALINNISYDEIIALPLDEVKGLIKSCNFLYQAPKPNKYVRNLNLNGKKYEVMKEVTDISTAQFIDYNSLINDYDNKFIELLSIFIIPKGHKYNQDYDIKEVISDIGNYLSVEEALGLSNFFIKKYKRYITLILLYLEVTLRVMKRAKNTTPKMKEEIQNQITYLKKAQTEISSIFG